MTAYARHPDETNFATFEGIDPDGALRFKVVASLIPGDILETWCSIHRTATPHRWQPGATPPLVCLKCESETQTSETDKPKGQVTR